MPNIKSAIKRVKVIEKKTLENNKIKSVDDALDLKFESTENIKKILGPLYYLR